MPKGKKYAGRHLVTVVSVAMAVLLVSATVFAALVLGPERFDRMMDLLNLVLAVFGGVLFTDFIRPRR